MRLKLRVVSGLQVGDQRRLDPPGGFIGRGEGCALHLRDDSVSRSHVELRFAQDGWWAYQHSTRSPTLLDGVPVGNNPLSLRENGVLQVGNVAIEYAQERAHTPAADTIEHNSPPTMINVRRQLPSIQQAVLPQMTPLRAAEVPPPATPATLILRRPTVPAAPVPDAAPPTLIRHPVQPAASPKESSPPTLTSRSGAAAQFLPVPASMPVPAPVPLQGPLDEEIPELALAEDVARIEKERDELRHERDELRRERDRLEHELQRLAEENAALRALQGSEPPRPPGRAELSAQGLRLLAPFCDSLEQATEALQAGDAARARSLLREASFSLADLRDLFESGQG